MVKVVKSPGKLSMEVNVKCVKPGKFRFSNSKWQWQRKKIKWKTRSLFLLITKENVNDDYVQKNANEIFMFEEIFTVSVLPVPTFSSVHSIEVDLFLL